MHWSVSVMPPANHSANMCNVQCSMCILHASKWKNLKLQIKCPFNASFVRHRVNWHTVIPLCCKEPTTTTKHIHTKTKKETNWTKYKMDKKTNNNSSSLAFFFLFLHSFYVSPLPISKNYCFETLLNIVSFAFVFIILYFLTLFLFLFRCTHTMCSISLG